MQEKKQKTDKNFSGRKAVIGISKIYLRKMIVHGMLIKNKWEGNERWSNQIGLYR